MDSDQLRVLLVDDNDDEYVLINDMLAEISGCQFCLEWVSDYDTALKAVKRNEHDVCLLNYYPGEYDAVEFMYSVLGNGCEIPFIMLTENDNGKTNSESIRSKVADYLNKDELEASGLERSIRYAINQQNLLKKLEQETDNHKKTAEALVRSENKYRSVFELSPEAIVIMDSKGNVLEINHRLSDWLGYKPEQIIGKNLAELPFLPPESKAVAMGALLQRIAGASLPPYELTFITKNGEKLIGRIIADTMLDEADNIIHDILMISNITERKKVTRIKDELISTVSHELRTPLTSIHASLGLISGGAAGELPQQVKRFIDIAYSNSERLVNLINDILNMEMLESGKIDLYLQPVELMSLVEQAVEASRVYTGQFDVGIVLTNSLPNTTVNVDCDRLMQVFANLLSNAVKYSPPNGTVMISLLKFGKTVRVAITDHGPGIPKSFQKYIFQKFSQADSSNVRQREGIGLGLSIAKAIIEKHGGKIGFETELNVGTTFYFELPQWDE